MSLRPGPARDDALHHLSRLIDELGTGGGAITPSVYDTARVATLLPDRPHTCQMLHWLTHQQQPDGGWGTALAPLARDLPTLAAVLALAPHPAHRTAAQRGVRFLEHHAPQHWGGPVAQDIPVGLELLLPRLLDEARTARIAIPTAPYAALRALGQRRRRLIARSTPPAPGTAAVHSWEAWGSPDEPLPVDGSNGIGHSPAATATALSRAATGVPTDTLNTYLARATAAHPPLMPTVWPIDVFERTWALHALALTGLLHHPRLAPACARQLDLLHASLTPAGVGMSDHFTADGDITATATAVLTLAGRPCDIGVIDRFRHHDHYRTYPGELQPSLTTTAHALHALATHARLGPAHGPTPPVEASRLFLENQQHLDGRWTGDKWHTSWIYTTAQAIIALPHTPAAHRGVQALLHAQKPDGGWGTRHQATTGETGYAVLALATHHAVSTPQAPTTALRRAADWLIDWQRSQQCCDCRLWIGKELYCPTRVDQAVAHAALLTATHPTRSGRPGG